MQTRDLLSDLVCQVGALHLNSLSVATRKIFGLDFVSVLFLKQTELLKYGKFKKPSLGFFPAYVLPTGFKTTTLPQCETTSRQLEAPFLRARPTTQSCTRNHWKQVHRYSRVFWLCFQLFSAKVEQIYIHFHATKHTRKEAWTKSSTVPLFRKPRAFLKTRAENRTIFTFSF